MSIEKECPWKRSTASGTAGERAAESSAMEPEVAARVVKPAVAGSAIEPAAMEKQRTPGVGMKVFLGKEDFWQS